MSSGVGMCPDCDDWGLEQPHLAQHRWANASSPGTGRPGDKKRALKSGHNEAVKELDHKFTRLACMLNAPSCAYFGRLPMPMLPTQQSR